MAHVLGSHLTEQVRVWGTKRGHTVCTGRVKVTAWPTKTMLLHVYLDYNYLDVARPHNMGKTEQKNQ